MKRWCPLYTRVYFRGEWVSVVSLTQELLSDTHYIQIFISTHIVFFYWHYHRHPFPMKLNTGVQRASRFHISKFQIFFKFPNMFF
uniref:Uncharacterized protein n=1 Tax=Hordeum vulgare subsp. vulgare TaxID=112509 RepID=A0A8I6Y0K6_HORVV